MSRSLGLGRSPLRRPVDRVEAWVTLALLAVLLVAAPVLSAQVASRVYQHGVQLQQAQVRDHFRTRAVVLSDGADTATGTMVVRPDTAVMARWTAPDGTVRNGQISAPAGSSVGSAVTLWTDVSGQQIMSPHS